MDKQKIQAALKTLSEKKTKRNFSQSLDLIIAFKELDLKKPDNQMDLFVNLQYFPGKPKKVCALIGPELKDEATRVCDKVILQEEFDKYDKKKAKELATQYDFFIAQANIMAKIATAFGKIFGARGKMPNPKSGAIVPPKVNLKPIYDRLQKTLRLTVKTQLQLQCVIANEQTPVEEVLDNIDTIYKQIVAHLPNHESNIKAVYLKWTMSEPVKVE